MTATLTTALDTVESKLGKLMDGDNPVAVDDVTVTDAKALLAGFDSAVAGLTTALDLSGKLTDAYRTIALALLAIRSTIVLSATDVPDWAGNTPVYKAIARRIVSAAFPNATIDEKRPAIMRGVQNQMAAGVRDDYIATYVAGKHPDLDASLTGEGKYRSAFKKAVAAQYIGQGTDKKGNPRLATPVAFGGAVPEETPVHDPTSPESKTAKLGELLTIATDRTEGKPTIAPLVNATAVHRLLTDQAAWAMLTGGTGYADGEETKAVYAYCQELLEIISSALDGAPTTADTTAAFNANSWTPPVQ